MRPSDGPAEYAAGAGQTLAAVIERTLAARSNQTAGEARADAFTRLRRYQLRAADIRAVIREFAGRLRAQPPQDVIALALALAKRGTFEGRHVGYELIGRRPDALESITLAQVEWLGEGNDNWASVDGFACWVAGRAWRLGRIPDEAVLRWAAAADRWWRRTALVATVPLNQRSQGGTGDVGRTLLVCRALASDRDDMVVKALSWALRALGARDPEPVWQFLAEPHDALAARVRREVTNKLRTGRKAP